MRLALLNTEEEGYTGTKEARVGIGGVLCLLANVETVVIALVVLVAVKNKKALELML